MNKTDSYINLFNNTNDKNLKWKISYDLASLFLENKNISESEKWVNIGYDIDHTRIENLYLLVKYFRENSRNDKAFYYYLLRKNKNKPEKGLNIQHDIYDYLFDYEGTIIYYYVKNDDKLGGLKNCISYLNNTKNYFDNTFDNLEYYIQPLKNDAKFFKEYSFDKLDKFTNSSCSIVHLDDKFLLNIRYHNYYITKEGGYLSHEIKDNQYLVRTKNAYLYLNTNFEPISNQEWMPEHLPLPQVPTRIQGLEDMRIFKFRDKVYFLATSCHYSPCFRMMFGEYNYIENSLQNYKILEPPRQTNCEKNWIPIIFKDRINFIYSWSPLQIGYLEGNLLKIFHTENTPNYFSKMRGSSNPVFYNNEYWILTHSVKHSSPRKYYHQLVILDSNLKVKRFSLPFCFTKMTVEYCLALHISDDIITFIFSIFDKDSNVLQTSLDKFYFIDL